MAIDKYASTRDAKRSRLIARRSRPLLAFFCSIILIKIDSGEGYDGGLFQMACQINDLMHSIVSDQHCQVSMADLIGRD